MAKRKRAKNLKKRLRPISYETSLSAHNEIERINKHIDKIWEFIERSEERLQDIEIHVNLLTRLLTTICIEKFGMRIGVLKRLIKRIEKEAIRDSQIMHLESLYKLPHPTNAKKNNNSGESPKDPWENIS